jgi:hypothetical protein
VLHHINKNSVIVQNLTVLFNLFWCQSYIGLAHTSSVVGIATGSGDSWVMASGLFFTYSIVIAIP